MRGNILGKMLSMTTLGESHGPCIGAVLDGVPSCLDFNVNDLISLLKRRAPGQIKGTSDRKEEDTPEILSGIFENKTLGTPIAIIVRNTNQKSHDYDDFKNNYRIGHADKTTIDKFGIRDHRGGGRSSGRETVARVIAGYFAKLIIPQIVISTTILQIGDKLFPLPNSNQSPSLNEQGISSGHDFNNYLEDLKIRGESVAAKVQITIKNIESGLGEPVFDKLKADLAKAMLSIGGCVSFAYGISNMFLQKHGSEITQNRKNFGGIEGGISNGDEITFELIFKAPSTVGKKAKEGRHDPCLVPRVLPVIESMSYFILADHYLRQKAYLDIKPGRPL